MIQNTNDVCKEVLTVLAYCNEEIIEKIPNKIFNELNELAKDSKAEFYINTEKSLAEQNLSEECKNLISLIYYSYVAKEDEKKQIVKQWNENENKYQEKLRRKYNPNNVLKNKNELISNTAMIEYKKETMFDKIKKTIKNILKINQ